MPQSEITDLGGFELKLQFIRNQGDEFRIGGLALGIADGIAEEPLQGIQISPIPRNLNGMANGSFHSGRCGLECFRHLGVQYFGDGISLPGGKQGVNRGKSMV